MFLTIKLCTHVKLNVWKRIDYLYKMDLALNNLQKLICHKINPTTQPTNQKCLIYLETEPHIVLSVLVYIACVFIGVYFTGFYMYVQ